MTQQENNTPTPAQHRTFEGEVVAAGADKTISVLVKTAKMNKKYKKQYTASKKYAVQDGKNEARVGDTVRFREGRPMSKTKRWYMTAIVKKA